MAERESQFITLSRQSILVATAMGVGLLTFSYVIGVQVGKRSLTQNNIRPKTLDEELKELPEPLSEQLKLFKSIESGSSRETPRRSSTQKPDSLLPPTPRPTTTSDVPNPSTTATANVSRSSIDTDRYTAQIIATGNPDTARRISEQLKSQGFNSKIVSADGLHRVQIDWYLSRAELDARLPQLESLGHKPMRVKIQ